MRVFLVSVACLALVLGAWVWWQGPQTTPTALIKVPPASMEPEQATIEAVTLAKPSISSVPPQRTDVPPAAELTNEIEDVALQYALHNVGRVEPLDPIETGPHELLLTVTNPTGQSPVRGKVELWRVGAPANSYWSLGDQRQQRGELDEEGLCRFIGLAPGEYRAVIFSARAQAPWTDSFEVRAAVERVHLFVETPISYEAFVKVYDSKGSLCTKLGMRRTSNGGYRSLQNPNWVVARKQLSGPPQDLMFGVGGSSGTLRRPNMQAGSEGFLIRNLWGPSRNRKPTATLEFRSRAVATGPQSIVKGKVGGDPSLGTRYIGLLPDPLPLLESVLTPDGRTGRELANQIKVSGGIIRDDGNTPWTAVPVTVSVKHPAFEPLQFIWRPQDGNPPTRRLVPAKE